MNGTIIFILVIIGIVLLGRYALKEGIRIEKQKKFIKNMKNYDNKRKNS
jgi:Sec-independent protein translocase protein TatA